MAINKTMEGRQEKFPLPAEHAERVFRYSDSAARLLVKC